MHKQYIRQRSIISLVVLMLLDYIESVYINNSEHFLFDIAKALLGHRCGINRNVLYIYPYYYILYKYILSRDLIISKDGLFCVEMAYYP